MTHQNWHGKALTCTCRRSECLLGWHLWTLLAFCLKTLWPHSATEEASLVDAEPWSQRRQGKQAPVSVQEHRARQRMPTQPPQQSLRAPPLTRAGTQASSQSETCCRHPPRSSHLTGCTTPWATRSNRYPVCGAQNQLRGNLCERRYAT